MKILSVDVAAKASGWALFDDGELLSHGVVTVRKLDGRHAWMWELFDAFRALPWEGVGHVVAEFDETLIAWRNMNVKSKRRMCDSMAVLTLAKYACSDVGAELHEVRPRDWQEGMLSGFPGYPEDTKGAAVGVARQLWPFEEWGEHDADAALMGHWWARKREWEGA